VILLDSDVVLLDRRYQRDPRFGLNHQTLQELSSRKEPVGMTLQALLEVVGILSFNIARVDIPLFAESFAEPLSPFRIPWFSIWWRLRGLFH